MPVARLIRHAESHANAGGAVMPNPDIPLSPRGLQQAQALAEWLPAPTGPVYVSSFLRTQQTAAPWCARHGIAPVEHPLIHEFSMLDHRLIVGLDAVQRRPLAERYWQSADPAQRNGAAAETFAEFAARVEGFVDGMNQLADGAVLFGHGIWIALLVWRLRGGALHDSAAMRAFRCFLPDLPMPNCAVWDFERDAAGQWSADFRPFVEAL